MALSKREKQLYKMVVKRPNEMYVTDEEIAVLLPDSRMLVITGNFKDITPEAANAQLQQSIKNLLEN